METNSQSDGNGFSVRLCKVQPMKTLEDESSIFKPNALEDVHKGTGLLRMFMEFPLTNKTDFVAFFIFNIFYFVFNCVYWINFH